MSSLAESKERTAEDRFTTFLAVLSSHLDDHDLRGGDLAARMYVSRSLLDRFVAAAAGETTARLRRRVLLERAAFRLRSSAATVLEVAIEAGYSSNEAFTRAFQRAYGSPPSIWRSAAGPVSIPARNGIHFYPPAGLRLPASTKADPMIFAAEITDQHAAVLAQLLDRAATLTEAQLDAPIEVSVESIDDHPTIRSLLSRLVGQMDMWNAAMAGRTYDFSIEQHESLASMRVRLASAGGEFAAFVRAASEQDRLGETFVDTTCDEPFEFTAAGTIAHVITYAAYRRTLVVGALASAGAAPVPDDPMHWFAP